MPELSPCAADLGASSSDRGYLPAPLEGIDDAEGKEVPGGFDVIDSHVHLFPDRMFRALWEWFDQHAWPVRYRLTAEEVLHFLLDRGVERIVGLHYAHKPGIARGLNRFMANLAAKTPELTGFATVHPGETDSVAILREAADQGLWGVKLHCHVQVFSPDDPRLDEVYGTCAELDWPLVIHAGREPKSDAYPVDPHTLCSVDRMDRVLTRHPDLRVCVPHLGADEFVGYQELLEKHDNLWLDTTMLLADYFPSPDPMALLRARPDRIMYGTDFPNIPYAWDREAKRLAGSDLEASQKRSILFENARAFFSKRQDA